MQYIHVCVFLFIHSTQPPSPMYLDHEGNGIGDISHSDKIGSSAMLSRRARKGHPRSGAVRIMFLCLLESLRSWSFLRKTTQAPPNLLPLQSRNRSNRTVTRKAKHHDKSRPPGNPTSTPEAHALL